MNIHGLVLNKNTPCLVRTDGHTAGPRAVTQALKALTTVLSEPEKSIAGILLKHTTKPAYTLASTSPVLTQRSCLLNGSSKSGLARVLIVSTKEFPPKPN